MSFIFALFLLAADGGRPDAGVDAGLTVSRSADAGRDAGVPLPQKSDAGVDAGAPIVAPPAATALKLEVEEVVFHARTPVAGIDGTTTKMTATRQGDQVRFLVPLEGLDTGIGLRNSHMKKYLDAATFPNAELAVSASILKPGIGQKAKGTFTVKGVGQEVELTFDVKKIPTGFAVRASFAIDLKKHGVEVPTYAGVTVKKDVKIETSFLVAE
jgi:polyisoprenoid-binding protein YceI